MTASADNFYLGFPKAVDMLFGLAMGITGRDTSTAPVHFFIGVVALAGVAGAARRLAGVQAAWLAVALLLASFNVWQLFGWQYVDLAQVLYAAVVFIVLLRWESARLLGWVVVLGVLCGAAFSVKYTAGALILAVALVLLVRAPRAAPRNLLVFGLGAARAAAVRQSDLPVSVRRPELGLRAYDSVQPGRARIAGAGPRAGTAHAALQRHDSWLSE
jgi:hypothetical protein